MLQPATSVYDEQGFFSSHVHPSLVYLFSRAAAAAGHPLRARSVGSC